MKATELLHILKPLQLPLLLCLPPPPPPSAVSSFAFASAPSMAVSLQMCRFSGFAAPGCTGSCGARRGAAMHVPVRCGGKESSSAVEADFDAKAFRHNLTRSKNYNRKGFGHKEETLQLMNSEYTS